MKNSTWRNGATFIGATGLLASVAYSQADFSIIEAFPGGDATYALGISRDGGTVVGAATRVMNGFMRTRAVTWTPEHGLEDLGALPGTLNRSVANAVTDNASFVSGSSSGGFQFAVRFANRGIETVIPTFGVQSFEALDLTADGQTMVGYQGTSNSTLAAFRWTYLDGTMTLDPLSNMPYDLAYHVSADGLVTVGQSRLIVETFRVNTAVWWDLNGHVNQIGPPFGGLVQSVAADCDRTGRFVYCWGYNQEGTRSLTYVYDRLLQTKRILASPEGWNFTKVKGCSQDGLFCVGDYWSGSQWRPYVAGPGRGMEDLSELLTSLGAEAASGWTLDWTHDIALAGDKLRIVGHGVDGAGVRRGFVAEIPVSRYVRASMNG